MCTVIWFELLRDIVTRFSAPLINRLKYFLIQFRFRRDIPILRYVHTPLCRSHSASEWNCGVWPCGGNGHWGKSYNRLCSGMTPRSETPHALVMCIGARVIIDSAMGMAPGILTLRCHSHYRIKKHITEFELKKLQPKIFWSNISLKSEPNLKIF